MYTQKSAINIYIFYILVRIRYLDIHKSITKPCFWMNDINKEMFRTLGHECESLGNKNRLFTNKQNDKYSF